MSDEPPSGTASPGVGVERVLVSDAQDDPPVDAARWAQLADSVLDAEGIAGGEMGLLFVDEEAIARLNEEHMGAEGPTDVLSFPIDEVPGSDRRAIDARAMRDAGDAADPVLIGDVVVCPTVAKRNAAGADKPIDDELALLVVHGVLHLLGMDHAEHDEGERMRALERDYLARFHR